MRVVAAFLGLSLALWAQHASAAPDGRTSSLSWLRMPGADECIATQALARAVEDRLQRPGKVFVSAAQADVSVEGRIEKKKPQGWHAVITIRDAKGQLLGTRELERPDASCEAMTEPLTFVIAVMIDPEAAMRKPEPVAPAPDPTPKAEPKPEEPAVTTTTTATSTTTVDKPVAPAPAKPKEPWRMEGGADALVAFGMLPGVAPGGGVYGILFPPGIPVGFRGFGAVFPSVLGLNTADKDGASASFDMLWLGGSVCPTARGRVNWMVCLGGLLGATRPRSATSGRGIDESILPIWNAVLELRTSFTIVSPIGATAGFGGMLPLLRPEVDYRTSTGGTDVLFQTGHVAATADVGLGFVAP
jgi:hypothetical protein